MAVTNDEVLTQEQVLTPEETTQGQANVCPINPEFDDFLIELNEQFGRYFTSDKRFFGNEITELETKEMTVSLSESESDEFNEIERRAKKFSGWYDRILHHRFDDPSDLAKAKKILPIFKKLQTDIEMFDQLLTKKLDKECPATPTLKISGDSPLVLLYNHTPEFDTLQSKREIKEDQEKIKLENTDYDLFLKELNAEFGRYCTEDGYLFGKEIDELSIKFNDTSISVNADEVKKMREIESRGKKFSRWYGWIFNNRCDNPEKLAQVKNVKSSFSKLYEDIVEFDQILTIRKLTAALAEDEACTTPKLHSAEDSSMLLVYNFSSTPDTTTLSEKIEIKEDKEKTQIESTNSDATLSASAQPLTDMKDSSQGSSTVTSKLKAKDRKRKR